ncbi:hypothetical protein B0J13DRAFT_524391 [Dactylonectria estremocensis]|uniref:Uncharacterized protein n=1 Tax=Dactylonectria estremocensis TaxID=1079267 RepID=A0A9P9J2N8_9HYPO|nr:hypothetical protein B0J13DRAFT_524391 [Dactylonectria estremocensis]
MGTSNLITEYRLKGLVKFNMCIVGFSLSMDVLIISMMSLYNTFMTRVSTDGIRTVHGVDAVSIKLQEAPDGSAAFNGWSKTNRDARPPPLPHRATTMEFSTQHSDREATKPPACLREKYILLTPTTIDVNLVLPILSSDSDRTDGGSDTEQMLDDQLDPTSPTPTRKRKQQSTPETIRSKRTTAGKRRAQLYD